MTCCRGIIGDPLNLSNLRKRVVFNMLPAWPETSLLRCDQPSEGLHRLKSASHLRKLLLLNNNQGNTMVKPNTPTQSAAVFKRVTFSLTDQISEEIDRLSLIPRGFRASRSDVVRAGVAALADMTEEQVVALLDKVRRE